jgi:putative membrane protein
VATRKAGSADALSQNEPDLGAMRTMMAADQTLMAWIRTSLGLLSFGYTLYKILQEVQAADKAFLHDSTPRNAGLFLTVAGTLALTMGILEYCATLRLLRRYYVFRLARPSLIMPGMMAMVGVLLSVGIVARPV